MSHTFGEGNGKLAAGIVVAKEHVGYCRTTFGARIPGFDDGGHEFVGPVDGERTSVDKYQYDGLASGLYGLEQLQLAAGQVETTARLVLAAGALAASQYHDGHVGTSGVGYGTVYFGLFVIGQRIFYQFTFGPVGIHQVATLGVEHFGLVFHFGLDAFEHRRYIDGQRAIVGQRIAFFVGIGAADGNGLNAVDVEGQSLLVVFQQDNAFARSLQSHIFVCRILHLFVGSGQVGLVGSVKEADEELHAQDIAYAVVYQLFAQAALLYQFAERLHERFGRAEGTAHVQPCLHALAHGFLHVLGRAVLGVEVFDGVAVRHDISLEAHLAAQAGGEPVETALDGDAVVVVVRAHHTQQSCFLNDASEGIDVYHLHFARRHLRVDARHAFAGALVITVSHEVLGRGGYLMVLLQAMYHLDAQFGHKVRRLAVHFFIASPALVAPHVEDGGIDIGIAQHAGFAPRYLADAAHEAPVPGVSDAQLGGEVGGAVALHAADAFVGEVYGDAQARLFDEETLHFVQGPGVARGRPYILVVRGRQTPLAEAVQVLVDGADAVFPQRLFPFGCGQVVLQHALVAVEGHHLTGFLVECHLAEQVLDACVDGGVGVFVDILHAVLVKINPALAVHFRLGRLIGFRSCLGCLGIEDGQASAGQQGRYNQFLHGYSDFCFLQK